MNRSLGVKIIAATLVCVAILCGQEAPRVEITGRVFDDSTSFPLQNVNVFLAHTSLGGGTDENGWFHISNVPVGSYEIVASRLGYSFTMIRAMISESGRKDFTFRLKPSAVQISEVVITAPDVEQWKDNLKRFLPLFLGKSENAANCRILNPEVLDFESSEGGSFIATARAPLEIENRSLGYRIRFFLTEFRVGELKVRSALVKQFGHIPDVLMMEGYPEYVELQSNEPEDVQQWKANRANAYLGSLRHFLSSLFNKEATENGFQMNVEPYVSGKEWNPQRRKVMEDGIVFETARNYEKVLKYKGVLEIEYTRGRPDTNYDLLAKEQSDNQVSWLALNYETVTIDSRGRIKEWYPTIAYGYWAWQRLADALPLDFEPGQER